MRPGNRSKPGYSGTFGVEKCPVATITWSKDSVRSTLSPDGSHVCTVTSNVRADPSNDTERTGDSNWMYWRTSLFFARPTM